MKKYHLDLKKCQSGEEYLIPGNFRYTYSESQKIAFKRNLCFMTEEFCRNLCKKNQFIVDFLSKINLFNEVWVCKRII